MAQFLENNYDKRISELKKEILDDIAKVVLSSKNRYKIETSFPTPIVHTTYDSEYPNTSKSYVVTEVRINEYRKVEFIIGDVNNRYANWWKVTPNNERLDFNINVINDIYKSICYTKERLS